MKLSRMLVPIAASALLLTGCSAAEGDNAQASEALTAYATTGYIADAIHNIAPDAEVETMVGPGGDPHTHQPSTQDVQKLRDADLVFWNGLHLEAQMIDQLESLGDKQLAVGDQLPEEMLLPWEDDLYDPHVWNSPEAWELVIGQIADKFADEDPDNADSYNANASAYIDAMNAVHEENTELMEGVAEPRILVTGHDAFNYFGETYGLDVRATDFVSTEAELSATELSELADFIADNEVPVIFQDNQANPQAITALEEAVESRGWTVRISTEELFADTLGSTSPTDTHLGVFEHNARVVAEELS